MSTTGSVLGMARIAQYPPAAAACVPVEVYGPADAPLGLIRGRRRKRFLVRADRGVDLSAYIGHLARAGPAARFGAGGHRHRPLQLPLARC